MNEQDFKELSLKEIHGWLLAAELPESKYRRDLELAPLVDELCNRAWHIAQLIDLARGVDPRSGPVRKFGTPNKDSTTYKVRKAVGYSYP